MDLTQVCEFSIKISLTPLSSRIFVDITHIPRSWPTTVKVHPVLSVEMSALGGSNSAARHAAHRFGSTVAVFESPLDAKQTARLYTRSRLSTTDSAVETAVTKPQATTALTVAKGQQGPTGAEACTGDAVNPLTSLLSRNIWAF